MSLHKHLLDDGGQGEGGETSSADCAAGYIILHNVGWVQLLLKQFGLLWRWFPATSKRLVCNFIKHTHTHTCTSTSIPTTAASHCLSSVQELIRRKMMQSVSLRAEQFPSGLQQSHQGALESRRAQQNQFKTAWQESKENQLNSG